MKKNKKKISKKVLTEAKDVVKDNVEAQTAQIAKKPSKLAAVGQAAGNLVKAALPAALGAVPMVGPALASIAGAITKNDPEWFDGYKGSGATFNELLDTRKGKSCELRGNLGEQKLDSFRVTAAFSVNCEILNFNDLIKSEQFPQVLADVRSKTNNVLMDNVDLYWKAFANASALYAIYYTGKKYIEFAKNLPVNIANPQIPMLAAAPKTLSQFVGVIDNLWDYLTATVKLPEAYVRYLRWRFGTAFKSDNSDKAGYIMNDYYGLQLETGGLVHSVRFTNTDDEDGNLDPDNSFDIDRLVRCINAIKSDIAECGRAMADIKLAYAGSNYPSDVDITHYDSKEFNIRANRSYFGTTLMADSVIILDSKLDQETAIQSLTTSTVEVQDGVEGETAYKLRECRFSNAPFYPRETLVYMRISSDLYTSFLNGIGDNWIALSSAEPMNMSVFDMSMDGYEATPICVCDPTQTFMGQNYRATNVRLAAVIKNELRNSAFNALQIHNAQIYRPIISIPDTDTQPGFSGAALQVAPLGYDTAYIPNSALEAIHRTTLRNLFRIGYHHDSKEASKEVTDAVQEVIETVTES